VGAKLGALIAALALTAAGLLVVRQQRLQAVSDMAQAVERAAEMERQCWRIRIEIAQRIEPDEFEEALAGLGPMAPLRLRRCEIVCPPMDGQLARETPAERQDGETAREVASLTERGAGAPS